MQRSDRDNRDTLRFAASVRLQEVDSQLAVLNQQRQDIEDSIRPLVSEQTTLRTLLAQYVDNGNSVLSAPATPLGRHQPADKVYDLLVEVGRPMHYREIEQELTRRGVVTRGGKDPANSLLATYFDDARLQRVGRGTYVAKEGSPAERFSAVHLDESYIGTRPEAFEFQSERYAVSTYQQILLGVAAILAKRCPGQFLGVLNLHGRSRAYFSRDSASLAAPKVVPGTDIFAETNLNARDIMKRCGEMLALCGLSDKDLRVSVRQP